MILKKSNTHLIDCLLLIIMILGWVGCTSTQKPEIQEVQSPLTTIKNELKGDAWYRSEIKEITEDTVREALSQNNKILAGKNLTGVHVEKQSTGKYKIALKYSYYKTYETDYDYDIDIKNFLFGFTMTFSRIFANENIGLVQLDAIQLFKSGKKDRTLLSVMYDSDSFRKKYDDIMDDVTNMKWLLLKYANKYSINTQVYRTINSAPLKQLNP